MGIDYPENRDQNLRMTDKAKEKEREREREKERAMERTGGSSRLNLFNGLREERDHKEEYRFSSS
jgi:hypothetical protein